ncbi:MAG TPA: hypothetical protein PLG52_13005, partial [Anaerolineales bacterium]|nr:hypothetical protein [Anaerolineales bacterium]
STFSQAMVIPTSATMEGQLTREASTIIAGGARRASGASSTFEPQAAIMNGRKKSIKYLFTGFSFKIYTIDSDLLD